MTRHRLRAPRRDTSGQTAGASEATDGALLDAARGWAGIAREVHGELTKGKEAVEQVERRHNTSGQ